MLKRRGLLLGLLAAPAIVRTPGLLMPVRPVPPVSEAQLEEILTRAIERLGDALVAAFDQKMLFGSADWNPEPLLVGSRLRALTE